MKRLNVIWMFLLLLAGTSAAKAQATLSIRDFQISQGETKTVNIEMTNTVEVRALQVQLVLPASLKLASRLSVAPAREGTRTDEFGGKVEVAKTLDYNQWDDGSLMIVVNANDAVPFSGTEGAVITLSLTALEDAPIGTSAIELRNMELVFADGCTSVRPEDSSCQVDIREPVTTIEQLSQVVHGPVDVYTIDGIKVKSNVPIKKLKKALSRGIYVIEGYKIAIDK